MENQVTNNANALRLFFTEEVFLVKDENVEISHHVAAEPVLEEISIAIKPETNIATPSINPGISLAKDIEIPKNIQENVEILPNITDSKTEKSFKFLGGNKKSVLILVNDHTNDVSTEQGKELLRKIVKAVDLGTADFALVNYATYPGTNFASFHQFFKPLIMLSFGVEIADLELNYEWQNEIITHETTRIIFAPNLHLLDSDLSAKKLLWGNLQKIK
ncbi:hypothetical protein EV200_102474 [Pedobacter psychrotolerans]|uniref:Uncharacterized protein n=1 Tax=Pedobacter psychrotolerans TaxID=1843235 RepID=A0A4R2HML7_9SPHI|nr:hypothetical protein [Pedobacter psychrotolerans]TCO29055.1 hypothetical protein EV200_102474 [Pedobacter psychrotolerans]GGE53800.1 hypothetical protein GCM10011413_20210 [Pedobacter psychrotolerans]